MKIFFTWVYPKFPKERNTVINMYCSKCGNDAGDAKFCSSCGAEIEKKSETYTNETVEEPMRTTYENTTQYTQATMFAENVSTEYGQSFENTLPDKRYNLFTAFGSFFSRYVDFSGRSRRSEFWLSYLMNGIITIILSFFMLAPYVDAIIKFFMYSSDFVYMSGEEVFLLFGENVGGVLIGLLLVLLYSLIILIPSIAITVRRLHDADLSGWFALLLLVPYANTIAQIVFGCLAGTNGVNKYGERPKANIK